jgi:hypothetical protein
MRDGIFYDAKTNAAIVGIRIFHELKGVQEVTRHGRVRATLSLRWCRCQVVVAEISVHCKFQ